MLNFPAASAHPLPSLYTKSLPAVSHNKQKSFSASTDFDVGQKLQIPTCRAAGNIHQNVLGNSLAKIRVKRSTHTTRAMILSKTQNASASSVYNTTNGEQRSLIPARLNKTVVDVDVTLTLDLLVTLCFKMHLSKLHS